MPYPGATLYPGATTYPDNTPLTPFMDSSPCPRVLISVSTTATGTQTVTILRTAEGREMSVRGGINVYAVGGAAVMDYEVPFGVPVSYRAQQFDVNGNSLGFLSLGQITLAVTQTWIHQPMSPTLAIPARVFVSTASAVKRVSPGQTLYPEGASVGTRIGGPRRGLQGLPFQFRVNAVADADEFLAMWGSYSTDFPAVICVRTPPPARLPRVLFLAPSNPDDGPVETAQANFTFITYQLTADEVQPPSPGLVIPTLRRKDIDAAFTTRGARAAAYATRLARDTDYTKSGLAGP